MKKVSEFFFGNCRSEPVAKKPVSSFSETDFGGYLVSGADGKFLRSQCAVPKFGLHSLCAGIVFLKVLEVK